MELDHLFILCDVGAPEGDALVEMGLVEGSPNVHPGQGTACRRFFFETSYLELLWVANPDEVQSAPVRPTTLWDRWRRRREGGNPFGIVLRPPPVVGASLDPPFASSAYRPRYLDGASIAVASEVPWEEPAFFWLPFQRHRARPAMEPTTHRIGRTITRIRIGLPYAITSEAGDRVSAAGVVSFDRTDHDLLDLTIDDAPSGQARTLRPRLPLSFRF